MNTEQQDLILQRSIVSTLEQLLEVQEQCVSDQSGRVESLLKDLKRSNDEMGRVNERLRGEIAEHTRAEETLHEQYLRLQTILETASDGIHILDEAGNVVLTNRAFRNMLGYSEAEIARLNVADWDAQWTKEELRAKMAERIVEPCRTFETRHRRRDGRVLDIEISATSLLVGGEWFFYASARNITARKAIERQLRFVTTALKAAANGIMITDPEGVIIWVNPAFTTLTGFPDDEVIGQTPRILKSGKQDPMFYQDLWATIKAKRVWRGELINKCKDGSLYYEEMTITPVLDPTGVLTHFIAIMQNISWRKAVEASLQQANERLTALVRASPVAITLQDLDGLVRLWNPAAESLFGWTEDEVLGRPLPTVPEDRREEHRIFRQRVLEGLAVSNIEVPHQRKDGALVTVSLSAAPLRDQSGAVQGMLGVMADVTERKRMESQGQRIERLAALGQLLSGIAHELKNPLFVLTGRLQLLKEKLRAQEFAAAEADAAKVGEAAQHMAEITQRFLAMARPSQPRQEPCVVSAALMQTLEFLTNELMKNQIRVVTAIVPNLPMVRADPKQIQDVFLNLILNAIQAMASAHGRGTLTVSAALVTDAAMPPPHPSPLQGEGEGGGGWIEIRIQDDGPGIPREHVPKLFEPFFSTKPPEQGTGLGLWTVRTIVMAMRGTVAVETEVGRGAAFIVRLPVAEELNH